MNPMRVITGLFFFYCLLTAPPAFAETKAMAIPVPGTVTFLDLGSKSCIPCQMMEPILADIEKEYSGRAAILFIDVMNDLAKAEEFKITVIPTQIFFDKSGKEVWRHGGFLDKKAIQEKLDALLKE